MIDQIKELIRIPKNIRVFAKYKDYFPDIFGDKTCTDGYKECFFIAIYNGGFTGYVTLGEDGAKPACADPNFLSFEIIEKTYDVNDVARIRGSLGSW